MNRKKLLSLVLSLLLVLSVLPAYADGAAPDATITLTVSVRGVLASDNDGGVMLCRPVTVKDADSNGTLSVDEALVAAHKAYNQESGYVFSDLGGYSAITKIWNVDTMNTLLAKNHVGLTGSMTAETVQDGDALSVSVNKDDLYYADWYTYFTESEKAVAPNEEFSLTLVGHFGMAYMPEDLIDTPIANVSVGTWESGSFVPLSEKVTDNAGKVTLSFPTSGTYYVTASGTVPDEVTINWSTYETGVVDCPIIAPGCIVTVTDASSTEEATEAPTDEPQMSDADALDIIYKEFSSSNTNQYKTLTKTPLEFPLEFEGETYTNVIAYMQAWAKKETGRDLSVAFDYVNGGTSYTDWTSGEKETVTLNAFDQNTDIISGYFKDNAPASQRLSNTVLTVGEESSAKIPSIYVKSASLERTPQEIVDFTVSNLPFVRIQGKNADAEHITSALGETAATGVGALPTADTLYTKTSATIAWTLQNVSGDTNALKLASNKITVTRPNVGEADAKFTLTATVTSADKSATATKSYDLTVPTFPAVIVPIQVTEGATLSITDNYYKTPVDASLITKRDDAPEGFDLYDCALHTSATGTAQTFAVTVEKDGYITQSGNISVTEEAPSAPYVYDLVASSEDDTKLGSLSITAPTVTGFEFNPDVTDYTVEVSGATQIRFDGAPLVNGATVQITSYYSSLANANKGTLTTTGKALTTACYLPDAVSQSVIQITVTAPKGSTQAVTKRTYTVTVNKTKESGPLTALAVTASSSGKGTKNYVDAEIAPAEETLTPVFIAGGNEGTYTYIVNYFRDNVKVKPTAAGATITVNGEAVVSGKDSALIPLNVGDNTISVSVTKGEETADYTLIVHRKEELRITDVTLEEGTLGTTLATDGSAWIGSCNFAGGADTLHVTYHTNVTEGVTISLTYNGQTYTGVPGEPIELPVGSSASIMPKTHVIRTTDTGVEAQAYVISFRRTASGAPSGVASYLPAPGQFVNLSGYQNPVQTLSGASLITLGAFGGNVVYEYTDLIKNDPKNPYGIDFIVMGNCFTNSDGTTASGAAEPASVMVSKDGETWYELAGSEYYASTTRHNVTVTYQNGDTTFTSAADTPWSDSAGKTGTMPKNEYHTQPYYPDPAYYGTYQTGVGKNNTYTAESVAFTGTMVQSGFYPFGYADSHTEVSSRGNKAVNPYLKNHQNTYNGDGFDLAWAVDENGAPVELDEVKYIKVYNSVLSYGGATGEKSPEIKSLMRAMAKDAPVGKTDGLTALSVNGEEVPLTDGVYSYAVHAEGATTLSILPIASEDANIYVSNVRISSGKVADIPAAKAVRIIVQEGEKEPVVYFLQITGVVTPDQNADLSSLTLTPGDVTVTPDENGALSFTVPNNTASVRLTASAANPEASVTLSGSSLTAPLTLTGGVQSESIKLAVGENAFTLTVTSVDGSEQNSYPVTISRKSGSGGSDTENTIKVKFSLTGDTHHYDADAKEYTGKHTNPSWIKSQTVEIPKDSTVKYLTELMLTNADIPYTSNGVYISEVNSLAEFDNGPNSGWMYRHNGYIANEGYAARKLEAGDTVTWFYTDDYTKEKDYEDFGGSGGGGMTTTTFTVTFETNGGSAVKNASVSSGKTLSRPDDPTKEGYRFDGWYTDKNLTKAYDFSAKVTSDMTLYAKWMAEDAPQKTGFADVPSGAWYENAVRYVCETGLFQGVSDTLFAPDAPMTRAMLVTVLYRMENPEAKAQHAPFTDVSEDTWYTEAVDWATENGIVLGMSDTEFAPDASITREQMATILYRYTAWKGEDTLKRADLSGMQDANTVSGWAFDAVSWAVAEGLIQGVGEHTIAPQKTATRAEVATILMRYTENIQK